MDNNEQIYLLVNYSIGNTMNVESLSRLYPTLIFTRISPGVFTVQVPEGQEAEFERLATELSFVIRPRVYGLNAQAALEASNISVFHNYPYGELRGTGILMGFIDTGIDYTSPYFQNADATTRIRAIWDQTITGNPPPGFSYGTLYTQTQINEALQSANPLEIVPTQDDIGHGTFLAGVAAGNDQANTDGFVGGAPDAGIVVVKLREASEAIREYYLVKEGEPAYQDNDIMLGINFLLQQAADLDMPLIVCLGLGNNFGAHNGTDILEGFLNGLSSTSNVINVVAAGNEANAGHHYKGTVSASSTDTVEVNVTEDEKGFVLYFWSALPNRIQIAVRSPLGQLIEKIPIFNNDEQEFKFNVEQTKLTVRYLYPEPFTGSESVIVRLETPTPGIWSFIVYGEIDIESTFHAWLSRRGFINEETRFLKPDPFTSVQIPATELFSIVVGAYDVEDNSIYVASGRGPTTDDVIKPDLIAPGVNVTGPRPGGGFTTYVGTSTAAAVTASACALLMQWAVIEGNFPQMNTRIARGILTRGASRKENGTYPNNIEGYGRLDLQNSITIL